MPLQLSSMARLETLMNLVTNNGGRVASLSHHLRRGPSEQAHSNPLLAGSIRLPSHELSGRPFVLRILYIYIFFINLEHYSGQI